MAKKPTKKSKYKRDESAAIREEFMASPHMTWVSFCEAKGWDNIQSRQSYAVRTWIDEKRRIFSEKQTEVLSGLIFERRFKWTAQILETLDGYPKSIDMAKRIADAKMAQVAELYQDYQKWIKDEKIPKYTKIGTRIMHPFERISFTDIAMLQRGMKDVTDAKLKALMLDKWAIKHLEMSKDEMNPGAEQGEGSANWVTVEGQKEITPEQAQQWMEEFIDKPPALPEPEKK